MIFKESTYASEKWVPPLDLLRRMLLWAGDGGAMKIVIPRSYTITQPALTLLLEASPRLEHLDVHLYGKLKLPSNEKIWDRLRHVSIMGFFNRIAVDLPGGFPQTFLQNAAGTLQHLDITSIPLDWYNRVPSIPLFPKLKTLRMHGGQDVGTPFSIYPLSIAFPRLEQLSFAEISELRLEPVAIRRKELKYIWPHLKVLMFQSGIIPVIDVSMTYSTLRYLASLNSLQHIHFNFGYPGDTKKHPDIFGGNHDLLTDSGVFPHPQFQNLRSLRSEGMWISPDRAQMLLSNAVKNKKLTSFDIVFPWRATTGPSTAESIRHLKDYDWLRGNPTIHTLGCQHFYFSFDPEDDNGRLLPQFLATFPNLRTLKIFSKHCTDTQLTKVVLEIMKVTHLKIIHLSYYRRQVFLGLEEVARSKGIKVFWRPEALIWPISLEQ
ncbi:hypothetical protein E4U11_004221 [Claviceps purpurea]|nr:hypothetical protein E4U11_004221 [Claviceps purpurea]